MKNRNKCRLTLISAVTLIVVLISYLIFQSGLMDVQNRSGKETVELVPEGETGEASADGDPGLSDEELQLPVGRDKKKRTRQELINVSLSGIGNIPFLEGGRMPEFQFPELSEGIDNRLLEKELQIGVDSLGYVQWVYNQLFQVTIKDPAEAFRRGNKINLSELRPGDIAMRTYHEEEANHYGIFLGYDNGVPVVAHCDSGPWPLFPEGVVKLSEFGEGEKFYMGTPSEHFSYFTRPDVAWEEDDFDDDITSLMKAYTTEETANLNQCGAYGAALIQKIRQKSYDELLEGINLEVLQVMGYKLDSAKYIKKIENLSQMYAEKKILVYNISELPDSGAIVARFCLAAEKKGANDEMIYDSLHCQWQDITFYLNNLGEVTSYLPCHEAMLAYGAEYGFVKE